jgi:DNA-binding transcriptional regulator/RsmH inhibitor MraZ
VLLATKDRVPLPVVVRNLLGLKGAGRLVADLVEDGRALLLKEDGFRGTQNALSEAAGGNSAIALAALDRFQMVPVTAEGRLVLSVALRAHLDALTNPVIRLVVSDGRLTLWSERQWRLGRADRMKLTAVILEGG